MDADGEHVDQFEARVGLRCGDRTVARCFAEGFHEGGVDGVHDNS